ncbi:hypothetical protein HDU98_004839 [Podochytrium sp. JEL0797]|nr:hypothetical protein HDU98_004839 [Podochytrium sp. JEL0797]
MPAVVVQSKDFPDEETAWRQYQQYLLAELNLVNDQLRKFGELKKAEEAKEAEGVRAEKARLAKIARRSQTASSQVAQAARSRIVNARGSNCIDSFKGSANFPLTMKDVACVVIAKGGYAVINESGSGGYHGIPSHVAKMLDQHRLQNLRYLALSQGGQCYLAMTNGHDACSGSKNFGKAMGSTKKLVRWV